MSAPRTWSARSLGARWQHAFFYGLIRLGGRRVALGFADLVSAWYVLLKPSVRARCAPYLDRRFPDRRGVPRLLDAWRLSRAFAHILVDRAALGILGPEALRTRHEGGEALLGLVAEGRGLVLLTAHVGAWQLGMQGLPHLGVPVTVVMHRDPGDVDRQAFEHRGGEAPFRILDPATEGPMALLAELERGGTLCFMGDRLMPGTGGSVEATFLGGTIRLPFGPFRLAAATGAPLAICFFTKPEPDRFELEVATVLRLDDRGRRPEAYADAVQAFAEALEVFVAREPYCFFNFFDLWSDAE